jgi:predicted alpha/beta-hydrolase family hydrolase
VTAGKRFEREMVRGWLHEPAAPASGALVLTHGAAGNCEAPLLRAAAQAFSQKGWMVLRFDLPFRQSRPHGPPLPAQAARDREGIARAADALRGLSGAGVCLGGHSYGGRQATMAAAENPALAAALLLLSYPLHPPGKPDRARTEHFARLGAPALFVHGTRDPFGSIAEMEQALRLIPARAELQIIDGAPHGVPASASDQIARRFLEFCEKSR